MADMAQQGADATSAYAGPQHDDHSGAHAADLQEDLELTQNARLFAECLAVSNLPRFHPGLHRVALMKRFCTVNLPRRQQEGVLLLPCTLVSGRKEGVSAGVAKGVLVHSLHPVI